MLLPTATALPYTAVRPSHPSNQARPPDPLQRAPAIPADPQRHVQESSYPGAPLVSLISEIRSPDSQQVESSGSGTAGIGVMYPGRATLRSLAPARCHLSIHTVSRILLIPINNLCRDILFICSGVGCLWLCAVVPTALPSPAHRMVTTASEHDGR